VNAIVDIQAALIKLDIEVAKKATKKDNRSGRIYSIRHQTIEDAFES